MDYYTNKNVYITGGSSGIGLEVAKLLAARDARVVIIARDMKKMQSAKAVIDACLPSGGRPVECLSLDVADMEDIAKKVPEAVQEFGLPDVLIMSAGIGTAGYFEEITAKSFDAIMKINVYGVWNTAQAFLPHMKERGGRMAILSSLAGVMGMFGYSAYSTTKYALVGLAECLRSEFRRFGIDMCVVCPPEVDTPFIHSEADTLPVEARAVKNLPGFLKPEKVARDIVRGIARRKFLVIPGFMARLTYFTHRLTNGFMTRFTSDLIVKNAQRKADYERRKAARFS